MDDKIQLSCTYVDDSGNPSTMVENRVKKYLLPCLKEYGEVFIDKVNNVFKVAAGVGDILLAKHNITYDKHFFILISNTIAPYHFIEFIDWIREQPAYEDDYV